MADVDPILLAADIANRPALAEEVLRQEIAKRQQADPLAFYIPHGRQQAFHSSSSRYRLFLAGNRSGKTLAGAAEALRWSLGRTKRKAPNHGWIVSLDYPQSRDVAQQKIFSLLPRNKIKSWSKTDQVLELTNGSTVGFKSCDSGWQKFQGTSRDWIWFDEEPPEDIYKECLMRTVDTGGSMWITMTPLMGFTWMYARFIKDKAPGTEVITGSIFDNPYLSREEITLVESSYSEEEKRARLYGIFTELGGHPVFDQVALTNRLKDVEAPRRFTLVGVPPATPSPIEDRGGQFLVWELPTRGAGYIVGVDVAEGLEKGNFSAATVLDRQTRKQVAVWYGKIAPDRFAVTLAQLASWYNKAVVAVESNNHGLTTLTHLIKIYPRIYRRFKEETANPEHRQTDRLGFRTDNKTRPLLIDSIANAIRSGRLILNHDQTIRELITFVFDKDSRPGAQTGCHDDTVFALGIALLVADQMGPFRPDPTEIYDASKTEHKIWLHALGLAPRKKDGDTGEADDVLGTDY